MSTCTFYRIELIKELYSVYNIQMILVGNKVDLTESRKVTREKAEELAQSLGVETLRPVLKMVLVHRKCLHDLRI